MGAITRPGTEVLSLANCPCCGGDISAGDYGYSSFNPGWAKCTGDCKRKWKLGYVDDAWDAGKRWNALSQTISRKLRVLRLLKVDRSLTVSRDFELEDLEGEATKMLAEFKASIIGCSQENANG